MSQKINQLNQLKNDPLFEDKKNKIDNLFHAFRETNQSLSKNKIDFLSLQTEVIALTNQIEHFSDFLGFYIEHENRINNPYNQKFSENFQCTSFDDKLGKIINVYECFVSRLNQDKFEEIEIYALGRELKILHSKLHDLSLFIGLQTYEKKAS